MGFIIVNLDHKSDGGCCLNSDGVVGRYILIYEYGELYISKGKNGIFRENAQGVDANDNARPCVYNMACIIFVFVDID